jgi:two-component system, response regulator, stage 0 sporulation protein F
MKTILLADDNPGPALLWKTELEDEGYRVLLAEDGEEACRVVAERTPDVVILDISMPGVGGLESLRRIKAASPDTPVILFTSFDEDCLKDQRARLADACVEKRAGDLAELRRAIARALTSPRASNSLRLGLP